MERWNILEKRDGARIVGARWKMLVFDEFESHLEKTGWRLVRNECFRWTVLVDGEERWCLKNEGTRMSLCPLKTVPIPKTPIGYRNLWHGARPCGGPAFH